VVENLVQWKLAGGPSPEHHDALLNLKARFAESIKISGTYYILSRKMGCPVVDRRNQVCPEGHAIFLQSKIVG
jgi:hypothetical protein